MGELICRRIILENAVLVFIAVWVLRKHLLIPLHFNAHETDIA